MSLSGQLSNPDDTAFQAGLYKEIYPGTAKAIISEMHSHNLAMHEISTLVNNLPIHFLRNNEIYKYIIMFDDTCGGYECLFSFPVSIFHTRNSDYFLTV